MRTCAYFAGAAVFVAMHTLFCAWLFSPAAATGEPTEVVSFTELSPGNPDDFRYCEIGVVEKDGSVRLLKLKAKKSLVAGSAVSFVRNMLPF